MIDDTMEQVEQVVETQAPEAPQVDTAEVERRAEELYQARNFKMLRQQAEQIARERDDLRRQLESRQHSNEEPEYNVSEDELVEGKHLKNQKRYIDKQVEDLKQQLANQQAALIEQNIRSRCPDFDSVVSERSLAKLREEYPEVAASLNSSPDMQSKAIAAYNLIKKLGLSTAQNNQDKETIATNTAKVKPSSALKTSDSPLNRVNAFERGLTDAEKEAIFKRAQDFASNQ
jgi:hypothetical protein